MHPIVSKSHVGFMAQDETPRTGNCEQEKCLGRTGEKDQSGFSLQGNSTRWECKVNP